MGRTTLPSAIDHLSGDVQVGLGEARQVFATFAGYQAGGCQCWAARAVEAGEDFFDAVGGFDLQFDAEMAGEALDQLILEAGFAVAILEIGGRTVAGDHAQDAFLLNSLECAGRFSAAAEHQEESGRQQPRGAAFAECSVGKHRRSIRKGEPPPYLDRIDGLC